MIIEVKRPRILSHYIDVAQPYGSMRYSVPPRKCNSLGRSDNSVTHRYIISPINLLRTGPSCRISPRPEGYLDNVLRAASNLYPMGPPFDWLNALVMPKRNLQVPPMRSQ